MQLFLLVSICILINILPNYYAAILLASSPSSREYFTEKRNESSLHVESVHASPISVGSGSGSGSSIIITTFAGTGSCCYGGDGGLATSALINYPWGVATDSSGINTFSRYYWLFDYIDDCIINSFPYSLTFSL